MCLAKGHAAESREVDTAAAAAAAVFQLNFHRHRFSRDAKLADGTSRYCAPVSYYPKYNNNLGFHLTIPTVSNKASFAVQCFRVLVCRCQSYIQFSLFVRVQCTLYTWTIVHVVVQLSVCFDRIKRVAPYIHIYIYIYLFIQQTGYLIQSTCANCESEPNIV